MPTNVTSVTLNWSKGVIQFKDIDGDYKSLNQNGFYAILGGKRDQATEKWTGIRLLYIGQAYEQTIRERVKQSHDAYTCMQKYFQDNVGYNPLIRTGVISSCSQDSVTQSLFDDVEACLIHSNKPRCNTLSKHSYAGRTIMITNTGGYTPLLETCSCSD